MATLRVNLISPPENSWFSRTEKWDEVVQQTQRKGNYILSEKSEKSVEDGSFIYTLKIPSPLAKAEYKGHKKAEATTQTCYGKLTHET